MNMQRLIIVILLFIVPLQGMGLDLISPSMPTIVEKLHTSMDIVELTLPLYLIGFALAQPIMGTFSDVFGRKAFLVPGMFLYVLISLACSFALNIETLLILRFFQGMSVAASAVISRAIIMDMFKGEQFKKMMGYVPVVWALGPIVAPTIGGYLNTFFGWQSSFYFFAIYGSVLFLLILLFIPETHHERSKFSLKKMASNYLSLMKNRGFLAAILCLLLIYSVIILFNLVGPFFIQDVLGYSCVTYGNLALLMGVAFFFGNLMNRILARYKTPMFWMECALIGMCVFVVGMVGSAWLHPKNLYVLMVPTTGILVFAGVFYPHGLAGCLGLFKKNKGTVSAVFGLLCTGGSALVSTLGTLLKVETILPLSIAFFCFILTMTLAYYGCFRRSLLK